MFTQENIVRSDWPLLQNGPINLFWRKSIFNAAILDLEALSYRILRIRFENMDQFYGEVSTALKWKEQFGYDQWKGNLDALNDGFRGEPFDSADDSAFCLEDFHLLVAADPRMAKVILDILARQSRSYLLFGKRLIGLFQTDDKEFHADGLGGTRTNWNEQEWSNRAL